MQEEGGGKREEKREKKRGRLANLEGLILCRELFIVFRKADTFFKKYTKHWQSYNNIQHLSPTWRQFDY